MLDDMHLEKNLDQMVEPSAEEREFERRLLERERAEERKAKDKKEKRDKDKKKSKSKNKKKKDKKDKKSKDKKAGSSSSDDSDELQEPSKDEVLALDKQLRDLGIPVRKFGETHLDRLKRWNFEKERRAAARIGGTQSSNPKREGWMTAAAHEEGDVGSGRVDGAEEGGAGESAKAAALMGSLDALLMGTSSVSEKQQKRDNEAISRNDDQPAFLKHMTDVQAGIAPGAPGLWVPKGKEGEGAGEGGETLKNPASDDGRKDARTVIGDGGSSWKARQLARLKERAATEGKSLQELAEKQVGESLMELQAAERESRGAKTTYGRGGGGHGGPRRGYLDDVGTGGGGGGKAKMIRPEDKGGEGLRWKGGRREEERRKKEELWDRTGERSLTGSDQVCLCVFVADCISVCLFVSVCLCLCLSVCLRKPARPAY